MKLPPLINLNSRKNPLTLNRAEIERYSRHILIPEMGLEGQTRLKNSKVLVIGAGGLGSPTLLYLAAAGIGHIGIVEFDVVEDSNLQRQIIHTVDQVGHPKSTSAQLAIQKLNPHVTVTCHPIRLSNENVIALFSEYDLIVDGTDNFSTRYLINDACILTNRPYIWGSIFQFEGQTSVFWEDAQDIDGKPCGINYRDLYPAPPPPEFAPSCSEGGVLGILCASIASVMTTEAIKLLTGMGESLLGKLMTYDALDMSFRTVPLRPDPQRQKISALSDYDHFCGIRPHKNHHQTHSEIDNIYQINPLELQALLHSEPAIKVIDVREQNERDISSIQNTIHITRSNILSGEALENLLLSDSIVVHCKSGIRSQQAAIHLREKGYTNVMNLAGGILAWIDDVDPTLPRY